MALAHAGGICGRHGRENPSSILMQLSVPLHLSHWMPHLSKILGKFETQLISNDVGQMAPPFATGQLGSAELSLSASLCLPLSHSDGSAHVNWARTHVLSELPQLLFRQRTRLVQGLLSEGTSVEARCFESQGPVAPWHPGAQSCIREGESDKIPLIGYTYMKLSADLLISQCTNHAHLPGISRKLTTTFTAATKTTAVEQHFA